MIRNIILDVDGTLWDCSETIARAWNAVYERRGLPRRFTAADAGACMGLTINEISDKLLSDMEPDFRRELLADCVKAQNDGLLREGGSVYPGVKETLKELSENRYGLYIVSNCECGYIEAMLAFTGLGEYIDGFLCAGMTGKDKGENLRKLVEERSLKDCVYVGDTGMDEKACKKAGLPFVWAAYGFGKPDRFDAEIRRFSELKEVIKAL